MPTITEIKTPKQMKPSSVLDYYVILEDKKGRFVTGYRYEGYSGNAVMDEIKILKNHHPDYRIEIYG